jgi:hypothetical protein
MQKIIYFTSILALLSFSSCKKDPVRQPEAKPPVLSVKLHHDYLGGAQVDSAFATWKINGSEQRLRLQLSGDSLKADISAWQEGSGTVTLHIYANKKYSNQYPGQWVSGRLQAFQKHTSLHFEGPQSFADAAWFPRVHLKDQIGHEAVIALRPDDAYFFVRNPGYAMTRLTVDRAYWKLGGGIFLAGEDIWTCTQNCTDVGNEEYFKSLPQRIGNTPWNHISIVILFETDNNGGSILWLEHDL